MKRILILLFILFPSVCYGALPCTEGNANCWIVRADGGDKSQCNGHYNAAYPGSGTGLNCAYSHPAYAIGGVGSVTTMSSGDSLYIAYSASGYEIGYDMPNTVGCGLYYPWDCYLDTIVAGIDVNNKTKVYGEGWDSGCNPNTRPVLWGADSVDRVLTVYSNTDVRCLEITDHSGCMFDHPVYISGKIDNDATQDPIVCSKDFPNRVGDYAKTGLQMWGATNVNLQDLWIHGVAQNSIKAFSLGGAIDLTDVRIIGGYAGWETDFGGPEGQSHYAAGTTVTFTRVEMQWVGCGERYKPSGGFGVNTPHNCCSQDQGCYGDAITSDGNLGTWYFIDSNISNNTSDGIDLKYNSQDSTYLFRHKCEGNSGSCVKTTQPNLYIENSILLSNCAWWSKSPYVSASYYSPNRQTTSCNYNATCDPTENYQYCSDCVAHNTCRSPYSVNQISQGGSRSLTILNSTLYGTGDALILTGADGCGTGNTVTLKNNILYGAEEFYSVDNSDAYYCECGTGSCPTYTSNYNICYNGKADSGDCIGANDYITNPNLVGPIKTLRNDPHVGVAYWNNFKLTASSGNSLGNADTSVSLQSNSNDVENNSRGAAWDRGAWEFYQEAVTAFSKWFSILF